jgi:hypothetical protein
LFSATVTKNCGPIAVVDIVATRRHSRSHTCHSTGAIERNWIEELLQD